MTRRGLYLGLAILISFFGLQQLATYAATPQQCEDWRVECESYGRSECTSTNSCQWVEEGGNICIADMEQCSQTCFVDRDWPTDSRQLCFGNQGACETERDDETMWVNYDVLWQYGACGDIPVLGDSDYTAQQCADIRSLCDPKDDTREECLAVEYQGARVCEYYDAVDAICYPKLTPKFCGNYCAAGVDLNNTSSCFDSLPQCLDALVDVDPDEILPGSCNVQNVAMNNSMFSLTGQGISAAFTLDGFKPFENVRGLYVQDGETSTIPQFINTFLGFAIGISGAAVVVIIVVGGFRYVIAAAGASKKDAKKDIFEAIVGLIILLAAVAILNTINPRLLNLDQLEPITVTITKEELRDNTTGYTNNGGGFGIGADTSGSCADLEQYYGDELRFMHPADKSIKDGFVNPSTGTVAVKPELCQAILAVIRSGRKISIRMAAGHAVDRNCGSPGGYCTNHDDGVAVDFYGINGSYMGERYNCSGIIASDTTARGIPNDGGPTTEWTKDKAAFLAEAESLQDWAIENRESLKLRQLFGPVDDKQFAQCGQEPTVLTCGTNSSHENHPHFTVKSGGC